MRLVIPVLCEVSAREQPRRPAPPPMAALAPPDTAPLVRESLSRWAGRGDDCEPDSRSTAMPASGPAAARRAGYTITKSYGVRAMRSIARTGTATVANAHASRRCGTPAIRH